MEILVHQLANLAIPLAQLALEVTFPSALLATKALLCQKISVFQDAFLANISQKESARPVRLDAVLAMLLIHALLALTVCSYLLRRPA